MAREIEVKFKVSPQELSLIKDWLNKNAEAKGRTHHIEYYLDNPDNSFIFTNKLGIKDSTTYLRVRTTEKGDTVCLKVFAIDSESLKSENLQEIEFSVSEGEDALGVFKALGFTNATIVDKTRQKFDTAEFEIVIDDVKDLGTFVEIELKEQIDGDIKIGFKKIYDFCRQIGLKQINTQSRGYVSMLWNKDKSFDKIKEL